MMNLKAFCKKLNEELDSADFPHDERGRVKAFSKVFGLQLHVSRMIINGQLMPPAELVTKIAEELEIREERLLGNHAIS